MPYRTTERGLLRRDAMRARILAAARRLFASQGYQATTLREVVEQAGTSIGNCYFYFADKEKLLEALVEEVNSEVGAVIDRAVAEAPPSGAARLAVSVYVGVVYALQNPALARLAFMEAPQARPPTAALAEQARRIFKSAPGLVGSLDPHLAALAWQGAMFQVLEATASGTIAADPDQLGRFLARWNLQALGLARQTIESALQYLETFVAGRGRIFA